jgi:hypothetical protein
LRDCKHEAEIHDGHARRPERFGPSFHASDGQGRGACRFNARIKPDVGDGVAMYGERKPSEMKVERVRPAAISY